MISPGIGGVVAVALSRVGENRLVHCVLAVSPGGSHSVFDQAASQAMHIERLFWFMFVVCVAVYILTVTAFTLGGSRSYSSDRIPLPVIKNPEADKVANWWVGVAVATTVVTVFAFLVMSVRTGSYVLDVGVQNTVTIKVTGHQWWWEVTYPNSQADQTIVSANEIHIPVGQRVAIVTNSADVIHSFWAPSITGKRDLIPGYSTAMSFTVNRVGHFRGQCAEFCGLQHAHMGFSIVSESPEDFVAWQRAQLPSAKEPSDAATAHGREVFLSHACVMCHTIRGTTAGSRIGPDLTHIASRGAIAAELLPNNAGSLAGWITDPQRMKPGTLMPPTALDGQDLGDLVAYMQSLQ
jgi:cytochrome c oxidase subunit II